MAKFADVFALETLPPSPSLRVSRHSAAVRITHWINAFSFLGLLVSGIAVLLAHPRLYWGEAGNQGTPPLIDLPLPLVLKLQSGWGRSLHFLSAWICVLNGSIYVFSGLLTGHFYMNMLPAKAELAWNSLSQIIVSHLRWERPRELRTYNTLQRIAYLSVVFGLFPLMIWTGLAMSPSLVSVFPALVTVLGGQQSARTIHFFAASFLVLFLVGHIVMVSRAGFRGCTWSMIGGRLAAAQNPRREHR
jgi:thiosulfate reductase cytochrome b subunit